MAVDDGLAIGYLVVYIGNDFIEKEDYPIKLKLKENAVYIWHCITRQGYENKGVQSFLFEFVTKNYRDYDIYSVVDEENAPSLHLHKEFGFKEMLRFQKQYDGETEKYILFLKQKQNCF